MFNLFELVPNDISSKVFLNGLGCQVPLFVDNRLPWHFECNWPLVILLRGQDLFNAFVKGSQDFLSLIRTLTRGFES
jgi:hypothetical protein